MRLVARRAYAFGAGTTSAVGITLATKAGHLSLQPCHLLTQPLFLHLL
jgi:hypothetical protein